MTVATVVDVEVVRVLSPTECDRRVAKPDELTNCRPCELPLRRECLPELVDRRVIVLPSTGVAVETRGVECDGGVAGRTLLTYRRRE